MGHVHIQVDLLGLDQDLIPILDPVHIPDLDPGLLDPDHHPDQDHNHHHRMAQVSHSTT